MCVRVCVCVRKIKRVDIYTDGCKKQRKRAVIEEQTQKRATRNRMVKKSRY